MSLALLMNKKFKYKKSLLAAILSATLLAGCDGGGSGSSSDTPPVDSGTGSLPEVKPDRENIRLYRKNTGKGEAP